MQKFIFMRLIIFDRGIFYTNSKTVSLGTLEILNRIVSFGHQCKLVEMRTNSIENLLVILYTWSFSRRFEF